jgi:hypothetical protein
MTGDEAIKAYEWDVARWMKLFMKDREWAVKYMLNTDNGSVKYVDRNQEARLRARYGLPATYDLFRGGC